MELKFILNQEVKVKADDRIGKITLVDGAFQYPYFIEFGKGEGGWFSEEQLEEIKPEETGGTKHDSKKIRLDLLSSKWLLGVGHVLTFGAKKYTPNNWRKGIQLSRLLGACLRHVFAFMDGEDKDPETGLSHLYHASCCLMFAAELYETMPEKVDDRYHEDPKI